MHETVLITMYSVCVLVLSGLPGSGKTHLCQQLIDGAQKEQQRLQFIHVEYDKLMPLDVERSLIEQNDQAESKWKQFRSEILDCVDKLVQSATNRTSFQLPQNCNSELSLKFESLVAMEMTFRSGSHDNQILLIIIDDNMYYRSMRYSYYQLARKYTISFCQVQMKIPVAMALERNKDRKVKVMEEVISTMSRKLEEPDPKTYSWEKHSLCLDSCDYDISVVYDLIKRSVCEPVQPLEEVDLEQRNQSRVICLESLVHQSDQILRRLVSEEMQHAKDQGMSKENMKITAETLQKRRKHLLLSLKDGSLNVPAHIVAMVTDMSKTSDNELYLFLKSNFVIGVEDR